MYYFLKKISLTLEYSQLRIFVETSRIFKNICYNIFENSQHILFENIFNFINFKNVPNNFCCAKQMRRLNLH